MAKKYDWKLVSMLLLDFFIFSFYSMPTPFFPAIALDYGLGTTEIGLIFGTFALGSIFCSLMFGKIMSIVGKHKLLYISVTIAALSTISFGFLTQLKKSETDAFLATALVIRFVSGFMSGGVLTVICGFLPLLYRHDQVA